MYIYIYIGGWGVSPTGKSQWFLHACDPVAGVEPENSPPRARAGGVPLGSEQLQVVEIN